MSNEQILDDLTNDVEELLGKLGTDQRPEIRDLRERLGKTIADTKSAIAQAGKDASETLKNYAVSVDDYVHDSPWLAIGTAAAAAAALGFLAGTLFASNRRSWN